MSAFFAKILNMSLTGSLAIVAVLIARLVIRKAPRKFSYLLWSVVLFRLLCPVSLSLPGSALEVAVQTVDTVQVATQIGRTSTITYLPNTAAAPQAPALSAQALLPWLWLAGVVIFAIWTVRDFFRLRRNLQEAVLLKNRVYLSDRIPAPFVLGLWKPKIYLPSDTPREEYQYIVSHERCHIHRGDHIVKLLAYCALGLHWFNPLVWLAFLLAGQDMEMSCDEAVVRIIGPQIRPDYAQALMHQASGKPLFAATPLSFGAGDVQRRIRHMARWKQPKFWVTAAALLLCIIVLVAFAINPAENTDHTEQAQYPGIAMNLPENMTLDTDENGNQIITNGAQTLGGIRRYKSKDGDFDVTDPIKCFTAMGLPQLTDGIQRDHMIGSGLYGDWDGTFYHPDEGETAHHFFFQGDVITEVWFHSDRIHPDALQLIMESVTFGQPLEAVIAIPQKSMLSQEAYALYRCRAVLEELQSNDAYKVHILKEDMQAGTPGIPVADATYWRSGDRWMRSDVSPDGPVWSKNGNGEDSIPWLFSYQWKEQEVVCVSTTPTEEGERIEIAVRAPYDDQSTDTYYVYFQFDPQGAFQYAKISAFYQSDERTFLAQYDYTLQVLSLDKSIIDQELDAQ